jgi:hypothetical protein
MAGQPSCHPLSKERVEVCLPFVFPSMNRFLKRAFIKSQSPRRGEVLFSGQTGAAEMGSNFARDKWDSTNGAIGRFHPVDSREAIFTDSPLPFYQEFFTADALRRQQELEESFSKEPHSSPGETNE